MRPRAIAITAALIGSVALPVVAVAGDDEVSGSNRGDTSDMLTTDPNEGGKEQFGSGSGVSKTDSSDAYGEEQEAVQDDRELQEIWSSDGEGE